MSEFERWVPERVEVPSNADYAYLQEKMRVVAEKQNAYFRLQREKGPSPANAMLHLALGKVDFQGWKFQMEHEDPIDYDEYALLVNSTYDHFAVVGMTLYPVTSRRTEMERTTPDTACLLDSYILAPSPGGLLELKRKTKLQGMPHTVPADDVMSDLPAAALHVDQVPLYKRFYDSYAAQFNFDAAEGMVNVLEAHLDDISN